MRVELRGLGALNVKAKRERQGRNPRTGETVTIDARRVVRFRASWLLLARLNRRTNLRPQRTKLDPRQLAFPIEDPQVSAAAEAQHQNPEAPNQSGPDAIQERQSDAGEPAAQPDQGQTHEADVDGENLAMLLQGHLAALAPGAIADIGKLAALLAGCLHQFAGMHAQGMHAGRLARMEAVHWEPPLLSFTIERHGAMALGSTRAELQRWRVDIRRLQASCIKDRGYRQLRQRAEPVKTEPMAAELAEVISEGRADDGIRWGQDGTVRVVLTKVFPYGSGYMQTIAGRRKRFRAALTELLAARRWREVRRDVYSRETPAG